MILKIILTGITISATVFLVFFTTYAQPYGEGVYGANVPYGSSTLLSLSTDGNVTVPLTPTSSAALGSTSGTVTVTSTDVRGYQLYVRAQTSANLTNGAAVLGASSNVSAAPLATNTWGYNVDGTTNFLGILTSDTLLKSATGPFTSGDTTTVYYGVKADLSIPAGAYSTTVMYTAVPQTN